MKKRLHLSFALLFFMTSHIEAQVNQWPDDLRVPEPMEESSSDSNGVDFISQQSLYMNTIISIDSLTAARNEQSHNFRQLTYYRLEKNELFESRKQYFDLSGGFLKKGFFMSGVSMGFDWTPILLLNSTNVNHALSGSIDVGPVIRADVLSLPIALRGGLAGKLQTENFSLDNLREMTSDNSLRDKGLYAAFDAGSADAPVFSLPLFLSVKGYGRSQKTTKLFTGIGSALYCRDLPSGDTLSLLYADSLVNGSGAVLGDEGAQGKSFFMDIPQSIIRSYQIKGGMIGKYRLHLQPALFYAYARHSLQYPINPNDDRQHNELSDRQNTVRSINAMLNSDSSSFIGYSGGLRIDLEKEEKLFQNTINMKRLIDLSNSDTLRVKLNDYDGYRAMMSHEISMHTARGAGIDYMYTISRYLKTYPNAYLQKVDTGVITVKSNEDKDWIIQKHQLEIIPFNAPTGAFSLIGEYSTNLSYYLKAEKSANNAVDYFYLFGANSFFNLSDKIKMEESVKADVKRIEYVFPDEYHKLGFLPPSYSREITAQTALTLKAGRDHEIRTEWKEHYEDDGYWFDKESIDTAIYNSDSARAAFKPYYGIERFQWRHSFAVKDSLVINNILLQAGSLLEYVHQKKYNDQQGLYVIDATQTRYVIVPFLIIESALNRFFALKARIKRNIDTVKDDYWDFAFLFTARF